MDRRRLLTLCGALLSGSLAGCTDDLPPVSGGGRGAEDGSADPGGAPDVDDEALGELVREINGFAFDLYRELAETSPEENLFASPASVSIALAMAYAGARGETRAQMADVMRYTLEEPALHETFGDFQRRLNERGADTGDGTASGGGAYDEDDDPVPFRLDVVNAVWGQTDYPFKEAYLDTLETHYGGGLREVDFRADYESGRAEINDWVAQRTEDRIDELLPEGSLSELTRLVLTNAVYFLANWEHPFSEARTSTETFTSLDGTDHDVSMMSQERTWRYAEVDGTQAVELPYVGGEASMLVLLPPDGEFESYERRFDGGDLDDVVGALDAREGTVNLPRFEFDAGFQLGETLRGMGLVDAFSEADADFGDIAHLDEIGRNLLIDDVYHDAFVAVDEEGTEAAAATGVVIREESAPENPFEFVADRPFLFALRDHPTDALLFVGRAVDPSDWD